MPDRATLLAASGELAGDGFDATRSRSVDLASTKVVAHLPPPWKAEFSGRGLVLGYVQSGKTIELHRRRVAKAADAGYRLFVVLSGIHNNLRRQTQVRLEEQLVELNPRWIAAHQTPQTSEPRQRRRPAVPERAAGLAVVKKNKLRLGTSSNGCRRVRRRRGATARSW